MFRHCPLNPQSYQTLHRHSLCVRVCVCVVEVYINICWAKEPVNHTLRCWPISTEGEGKEDLRARVAGETHTQSGECKRGGGERERERDR